MGTIKARTGSSWVWRNRMRRLLRHLTCRAADGVMMMQGRRLRALRNRNLRSTKIAWCWNGIWASSVHGRRQCTRTCRCSRLVGRVVQKSTDIMHEKRIQLLCDLLLVGKVKCSLEGDPIKNINGRTRWKVAAIAAYQTPLRCIGPILTTCLVFSLFKMPSRRPLVMPATLRSFVPLIM
jgi:hypothetical protein